MLGLQSTDHYRNNRCTSQSMTNTSLLSKSVSDGSLSARHSGHTQIAKHVVVLLPSLPVKNPRDILPKRVIERGNWLTKIKVWQRNEEW